MKPKFIPMRQNAKPVLMIQSFENQISKLSVISSKNDEEIALVKDFLFHSIYMLSEEWEKS